jgi:hypothetical protein
MGATSTLNAVINIVKKGGGDKETVKALANVKQAVTQAGIVFGALAGATYVVDQALKQTAGRFVEYETRIENTARITGMTMEQTSRLVQVMDDLFVSQESLNTGMEFAIRKGYKPSVEWLEQMADKISGMKSPADQTKEAIKLFGKASGPDMQKLMLQGKDGIDKMMASVEKGLVLTEESRQKALLYKQAMDRLGDSFEALKISIGSQVAPAVGGFIQQLANLTSGESRAEIRLKNLIVTMEAAPIDNQTRAYMTMAQALQDTADAAGDAAAKTEDLSGDLDSLMSFSGNYIEHQKTMKQLEDDLAAAREQGGEKGKAAVQEIQAKIDEEVAKEKEWTDKFVLNMATMQAAADGLSPEEAAGLLNMAKQMGLINEEALSTYTTLMKMNGLNVKFTVNGVYKMTGSTGLTRPPTPGYTPATPMAEGGDYLVTKPTLFMAGEAGPERATFTPLGGGGGGGGSVINVYLDSRLIQKTLAKNARMQGA